MRSRWILRRRCHRRLRLLPFLLRPEHSESGRGRPRAFRRADPWPPRHRPPWRYTPRTRRERRMRNGGPSGPRARLFSNDSSLQGTTMSRCDATPQRPHRRDHAGRRAIDPAKPRRPPPGGRLPIILTIPTGGGADTTAGRHRPARPLARRRRPGPGGSHPDPSREGPTGDGRRNGADAPWSPSTKRKASTDDPRTPTAPRRATGDDGR